MAPHTAPSLGGHMRTRATITLAATLLLTATACSSDDDPSGSAPSTPAPATTSAPASTSPPEPSGGTADGANAVEKAVPDHPRAYLAAEASPAHGMPSDRRRR